MKKLKLKKTNGNYSPFDNCVVVTDPEKIKEIKEALESNEPSPLDNIKVPETSATIREKLMIKKFFNKDKIKINDYYCYLIEPIETPEGIKWKASCPEICVSDKLQGIGNSPEEALKEIQINKEKYFLEKYNEKNI